MTREEFLHTLDQYNNATASEQEKQMLFQFCEKVQLEDITSHWKLEEIEKKRIAIFTKILKSIEDASLQKQEVMQHKKFHVLNFLKIAASVAILVGATWLFFTSNQSAETSYLTKTTPRGQRSTISLPDGSVIDLNSESTITFAENFNDESERRIRLTGEAFFKVARDEEKPFIVESEGLRTEVLGTSFNISALPNTGEVTVTVASGKVQVTGPDDNSPQRVMTRGHQAVYQKANGILTLQKVLLEKHLAWTRDMISLDEVTLAEAVEVLGRWYGVAFVFENEAIKNCTISGDFKGDHLMNILENIKFLTNVEYEIKSKDVIILRGNACNN